LYRAPSVLVLPIRTRPPGTLSTLPARKVHVTDKEVHTTATEMKQLETDETENSIKAAVLKLKLKQTVKKKMLAGKQIFGKECGACKRFKKIFRANLKDFGVHHEIHCV
jgi:hypothetical protein